MRFSEAENSPIEGALNYYVKKKDNSESGRSRRGALIT